MCPALAFVSPLDRDRAPLTDGGFTAEPADGGFAWRLAPGPGVAIGRDQRSRYLWLAFNGDQPEMCAPLWQFVPVTPGASYHFHFEYHSADLPPASGLRWSVYDAASGRNLTDASPWLSRTDWKPADLSFTAPAGGLVRLTLTCQRVPGSQRVEGSIELRNLSLGRHP